MNPKTFGRSGVRWVLVLGLVVPWWTPMIESADAESIKFAEYLLDDYHHLEGLTALQAYSQSGFRREQLRTRYQQNMGFVGREWTESALSFGRFGLTIGRLTVGAEVGSDLSGLLRLAFFPDELDDGRVSPYWEESTNPPSLHARHAGDLLSLQSDTTINSPHGEFSRPHIVHSRDRHFRGAAEIRYENALAVFVDAGFSSYRHVPSNYSDLEDTVDSERTRLSTTILLRPREVAAFDGLWGIPDTVEAKVIDLGDLKPRGILGSIRYDLFEPHRRSDLLIVSTGYSFFRERLFGGAVLMLSGFDSQRRRVLPVGLVAEWNGEFHPDDELHTSRAFAGVDLLTLIPEIRVRPVMRRGHDAESTAVYGFTALGIEYAETPADIGERFANMDYADPVRWVLNQQIHVATPGDAVFTGRLWFNLTELFRGLTTDNSSNVQDPVMSISITAGWY